MGLSQQHITQQVVRTRFTVLSYLMLGFYAYMQATLGPSIPFLRDELSMNYTVAGLHSSAFALGMILAGSSGETLAKSIGHKTLFWVGGAGMVIGGLLLTVASSALITVGSAFIMGFIGTYLLVMIQALLSLEFGDNRATALTESNLIASIFAACAPLMVGLGSAIGLSWRLSLWIGSIFWILALFIAIQVEMPAHEISDTTHTSTSRLPAIYWLYWMIVFIGVAAEWSMIFWAADFLVTMRQVSPDIAASMVSLLLIAMIVGRFAGSQLTRMIDTLPLLLLTTIIILLGFPIFWLSSHLVGQGLGIFIIGLGIANLFPLGLSAASTAGANDIDKASARVSQAAGFAILIAPQLLGTLADMIGIFWAYLVLPVLVSSLIIMLGIAWVIDRRR